MTSIIANQSDSLQKLKEHLRIPVIAAPMFLVSNPSLVIEACLSGVIGSFPAPNARTIVDLDNWLLTITTALQKAREKGENPAGWAINMITHTTYQRFDEELALIKKYKPDLVITALGGPKRVVDAVHGYGGLVFADVINVRYARKSVEMGADGLILVCAGAGGHTGSYSHFAFIEEVRKFFDGPIVLSGALSNGRAIRAAEILGADLAYVGTPFIATTESMAPEMHKEMVVKNTIETLVSSKAITGALGNWLEDSLVSAGFDLTKMSSEVKIDFSGDMQGGSKAWKNIFSAGQSLGQVKQIKPVSVVVSDLATEYEKCLRKERVSITDKLQNLHNRPNMAQYITGDRPDFSSPLEMFWYAVNTYPGTIALIQEGAEVSYKDFGNAVINFGKLLRERLDDLPEINGDKPKIGIYLPGCIATPVSLVTAWNIGVIGSMHNGLMSVTDVVKQFDLAGVDLIVTNTELCAAIEDLTDRYNGKIVNTSEISFEDRGMAFPRYDSLKINDKHDTILLLYSGGTTGIPKAVQHTHWSVMSSVKGMEYAWPTRLNKEVWVSVSPMSHVYGILFSLLDPIYSCSTNVLVYPFKTIPIVEALQKHRATVYSGGPPATYGALLKHTEVTSYPYLRICGGGGAPFPVELLKKLEQELGLVVTEAYGMTEMAPITCNDPSKGFRAGSVGKAGLSVELKIIDVATGKKLSENETGVICIRGNQQMKSYYNNEGATKEMTADGWINTGDVGHIDEEGFLFITGRAKEMINVSGYKVFPREVDERISEFPGVTESCTFGIKDRLSGEAVFTVITVDDEDTFPLDELKAFLDETLTTYKRPKYIEVIESIPKTQANKQDRLTLQSIFEQKSMKSI